MFTNGTRVITVVYLLSHAIAITPDREGLTEGIDWYMDFCTTVIGINRLYSV